MNIRKLATVMHILKWIGCLCTFTGCTAAPLVLNVEDVVSLPGKKAQFSAWLGQGHSLAFKRDVRNAVIRFYVNNEQVAEAVTDHDGQAVVSCNLPRSKAESFVAKTQVGKETAETQGTIFRWSNDKTIVAVDIDETISKTDYSGLFFVHVDRHSKPIGNSRDILEGMTKDYQIYYFSARPRFLHEKTKQWLKENRFPPGPVAHASKFEACLHQQTYKRKMLEELRERYPNMLVGIGDKGVDDKAFGANQMVTVLVNYSRLDRYSSRCVLCKDWNQVNQFFTTHRRQLVNPQNALAAIDDDTDMNTPVLVGEPTGPSTSN